MVYLMAYFVSSPRTVRVYLMADNRASLDED